MLKLCRNITFIAVILDALPIITALINGDSYKIQIVCLIVAILCFCFNQYLYKTKSNEINQTIKNNTNNISNSKINIHKF